MTQSQANTQLTEESHCESCGLHQRHQPLQPGDELRCARCDTTIRKHRVKSLDRTLALAFCGLALFVPANIYPIMVFEVVGRSNANRLVSGVIGLFQNDSQFVATLVFATSVIMPLIIFLGAIVVLLPIRLGHPEYSNRAGLGLLEKLNAWAMLDIYLLAIAVAYAKLSNFGNVSFGPGWYPLLGTIAVAILLSITYDSDAVRESIQAPKEPVKPVSRRTSLTATEALLLTAAILFVPSYSLPVLNIVEYGKVNHDTVYGSVLELTSGGQYILGVMVFCASIMIPTFKLIAMSFLVLSVRLGWKRWQTDRLRLYRIVEAIGRWSFVDLFVASILIALAELGVLATVTPGPGIILFAGVVITTMLAAMTFDPRLIWMSAGD